VLGPDIGYLDGSGAPAPGVTGKRLTFAFAGLSPGQTVSATYRIRPDVVGMLPLRTVGSQITFEDSIGRKTDPITVPMRTLNVSDCLRVTDTPQPTPTDTPTTVPSETPTPAVSPTDRPTVVPPDTATPKPTRTPISFYTHLPILLRQVCKVHPIRSDVMLVIDASSSMEEESGGQKKIDAARAAAQTFVGLLNPETDRAGVIAFNAEPRLASRLTADLAAAQAAIGGIQTAAGTRIDLALDMAWLDFYQDLTDGSEWRERDQQIIVLLTDGRPDPGTRDLVVEMARGLAESDVLTYVVGLGDDVDAELLTMLATQPDFYYQAPSANELASIYEDLAGQLPCPGGVIWGQDGP
jgi:Mg-chelatase subunit ChlD